MIFMPWLSFPRFPRSSRKRTRALRGDEGALLSPALLQPGCFWHRRWPTLDTSRTTWGPFTHSCPQGLGWDFSSYKKGFAGGRSCPAASSGTTGSLQSLAWLCPQLNPAKLGFLSSQSFVYQGVWCLRAPALPLQVSPGKMGQEGDSCRIIQVLISVSPPLAAAHTCKVCLWAAYPGPAVTITTKSGSRCVKQCVLL